MKTLSSYIRSTSTMTLVVLVLAQARCTAQQTSATVETPSSTVPLDAKPLDADQAAPTLTAMTYNLRLDIASDGVNAWPNRREALANQVAYYAPDVLGVQEAMPQQVDFLAKQLTGYSYTSTGRDGDGQGEACSIFFKDDRWTPKTSGTFWLSPKPDTVSLGWGANYRRICTYVKLRQRVSGQQVWVFNAHLDHQSVPSRDSSLLLITSRIAELNRDSCPVILMGDFNTTPETAALISVRATMRDAAEVVTGPRIGPAGTWSTFEPSAEPITRRIDYIWVSQVPAVEVLRYGVLNGTHEGRYLSDHLPVLTELRL